MKRINLIFQLLFVSLSLFAQTNFDKGFSEGYKKGYCYYQLVGCLEPISPIAPIPRVGESSNNYRDGYNRGFETGTQAYKSESSTTNRTRYQTAEPKMEVKAQKSKSSTTNRTRYQTSQPKYVQGGMYSNPLNDLDANNIIALAQALKESKGLALEYLEKENYQAVIDICYTGLQINSTDDEFMLLLGQAYLYSGDEKKGLKWLKKASRRRPHDKKLRAFVKSMK